MTPPSMYRYVLITVEKPTERFEFEAGPFTPYAAAMFGQNEATKKCFNTGKTWVCDYAAIVEASAEEQTIFPPWVRSIALWMLAGVFIGLAWEVLRALGANR